MILDGDALHMMSLQTEKVEVRETQTVILLCVNAMLLSAKA